MGHWTPMGIEPTDYDGDDDEYWNIWLKIFKMCLGTHFVITGHVCTGKITVKIYKLPSASKQGHLIISLLCQMQKTQFSLHRANSAKNYKISPVDLLTSKYLSRDNHHILSMKSN